LSLVAANEKNLFPTHAEKVGLYSLRVCQLLSVQRSFYLTDEQ